MSKLTHFFKVCILFGDISNRAKSLAFGESLYIRFFPQESFPVHKSTQLILMLR